MSGELRGTMEVFGDYVARAISDEADQEPIQTALHQFGRDLGEGQRREVERTLANYVLAGWVT